MKKRFDAWNELKKSLKCNITRGFKNREIYMAALGENVGFEQCGVGDKFLRPIVILKRFGGRTFLAIPLTRTEKKGSFYYNFIFKNKKSTALLTQIRLLDVERLEYKMGKMSVDDFKNMRIKIKDLV